MSGARSELTQRLGDARGDSVQVRRPVRVPFIRSNGSDTGNEGDTGIKRTPNSSRRGGPFNCVYWLQGKMNKLIGYALLVPLNPTSS